MSKWAAAIAMMIWLFFVQWVAGGAASFLCAITGIAVAVMAIWEAGGVRD